MKSSFSKRAVAVILSLMMVFSMVPMMAFSASAETTGTISTASEFKTAITNGGTYELTNDLALSSLDGAGANTVAKDTTIIGNGHKISKSFLGQTVFIIVNNNVTFNVEDVVFDGGGKVLLAVTAKQVSPNGATINLTDCTVQNFSSSASRPFPAVYYFSDSKGTLTNCTFQNNKGWGTETSGGDIWAGAAANVTIDGGTYSEIFANGSEGGSKAEITLTGGAVVEKANCIVSESIVPVNATVEDVVYEEGTATNIITTVDDLKAAAANGGTYVLDTDLTLTENVSVPSNLKLVSSNGATIVSHTGVAFALANENATLEMTNVTLDGDNIGPWAITAYTGNGGKNPNNIITLNDCTVKNFKGSTIVGAINSFGRSTTNLNNCTFTNNTSADPDSPYSGGDVWAGAAATINVNGGTYGEMYLNADNGGAGTANIKGGATVDKLNIGIANNGNTPTYTVDADSTVTNVVVEGVKCIRTVEELKAAAANGGTYKLDTDLTLTENVNVASNLKLVSSDGATIVSHTGVAFALENENATLEMTNVTLDGDNIGPWAICAYTQNGGKNPNNIITLNDCTVKNFKGSSYVGAINSFGTSTTNLNNCTFANNTSADPDSPYSGGDVWAGAAATINVNGGTYGEMYLNADNGGAGTANIKGGATVDVLKIGIANNGNTPTYTVADDSTVTDVVVEGINDNHNVAIGAAGYDTLEEALEAAKDGDVITSVSPEYQVTTAVNTAKNVTLDGFTFNMTSYQRNPLVMTGTDVAVKNCTFTGSFYNALETTQSKTAPLNSLTVEGCTFDTGRNNSVNVFSFVDGAQVNVSNNTFNCGDDCEAIRISNYTNAQNVKFTVDNNTYAPKNGDVVTQWDAFILFQDTTADNTTDFTGINVAVTNLNTTSANPLYAVCDKPCNDTTATVETMVTKDDVRVDLRALQAQVVLADGMVGIKVVGDNVTIDGTAVENGTLYLTPAQAADFDKEYAIVADGVTGTFTMNGYINALTDENAKVALRAFEVYAKAAANVFSGGSYDVASTYDFNAVDATPVKDDIYCGVSIDCSSKTQLIVYADNVAAGTAVKVNGVDTEIVTVDCGSKSHTAIVVPVNSINTPVTIEVDGKTITYSVKQASKLLSGVSGYEVLAAALANYGDALAAYTA